jgi:hypothetical protein
MEEKITGAALKFCLPFRISVSSELQKIGISTK